MLKIIKLKKKDKKPSMKKMPQELIKKKLRLKNTTFTYEASLEKKNRSLKKKPKKRQSLEEKESKISNPKKVEKPYKAKLKPFKKKKKFSKKSKSKILFFFALACRF
jgi:hypothetical protein